MIAPAEAPVAVCQHHWRIETPAGPTSPGRCKRCGATGEFPNADVADRDWSMHAWLLPGSAQTAAVKPKAWRKR